LFSAGFTRKRKDNRLTGKFGGFKRILAGGLRWRFLGWQEKRHSHNKNNIKNYIITDYEN